MKRFTLLLFVLSLVVLSFGQVAKTSLDAPFQQQAAVGQSTFGVPDKASGEVFWETSFNWANPADERGWTLPEGWIIADNADLGNVWVWRNDTLGGRFTTQAAPAHFVTGSDGFIAVPMDEYNFRDGVGTSNVSDTYIITAPIDCSAVSSVVVKFSQYFRLCCSNYLLDMLVTNDGGVHWASYDVRFGVSGNNVTTAKFRNVEINISDVAAGLPNVQIQFYMHGMAMYFWMIDDLKLAEAYQYDVVLEDTWMDFDIGDGVTTDQINYWPLSQMGMAGANSGTIGNYYFKAAFLNNGNQDAEDAYLDLTVLKNGTQVLNEISPVRTIWTLERDTQLIANPYLANDYGDYRFDFRAVFDNEDEVAANNLASMFFTVNDTLSHRADFSNETSGNTGGWVGGGNAGDMLVVDYDLYAPAEINSITAYIAGFTAAETPQFQFVLLKLIDEVQEEWIASDVIDMDSSYMNRWVTLPVVKDGETEFLEAGKYSVCVRMWGTLEGDADGTSGIRVGRDLSTKYAGCGQYYGPDGSWHSLAGAPLWMIGYNINETGGPTSADVTFNVDLNAHIANNEFHPGTDNVDVVGFTSVWMGPAAMTDADADGIYTVTVAGLPVGQRIEYKYRVNGVEEAFPTTGNLHRNYTIRYWNVINNRFNNGVTAGIGTPELMESFDVYPNPANGSFTVSFTSVAPVTAQIALIDMQGHAVYQHTVTNVTSHTETIDSRLPQGIYFLRVNSGNEVLVRKVVVN